MARVEIDPVTRIEGHMRVEIEVDGGVIKDAWVSGGLYRGMETILQGREPADAFYVAQRICGVCPISHGHASTMGSEEALKIKIPNNARIIRNIIEGAESLHSHILWFYTLTALDYVDVVSALSANIADTYALAEKAGTSTADFGAIQKRLKGFVEGGQLSIFTNGYWGHPAMKLPAELNLIAVAHYLEALEMQAEAAAIIAVMGGKFPHFMTSLPGGTAWIPTEEKLDDIYFRYTKVRDWITNTMIPDTLAIAPFYLEAAGYGKGVGNHLAWGVFDAPDFDPKKRTLPRGMIVDGKLALVEPDPKAIKEYIEHSWYESATGLNPADGATKAAYNGYKVEDKYSWVKAPRMNDKPMEVGPLSRMLVGYLSGVEGVKVLVDSTLKALGAEGKPEILISLLGRVAARNLEAKFIADEMGKWIGELIEAVKGGDSKFFTEATETDGAGAGLWEAPRGALGHWVNLKGGKIANYQVVTPSTWDCSPRDAKGVRGPMEEALVGAPCIDPEKPLEALRIVHSFDP
ncbi:MAG: nickel-dependent hydrogenase large subunit [Coriobacteriia bacterium]|nr:nickel-dependent hydrogenase large subunit [Coriobacteriia bacterium]